MAPREPRMMRTRAPILFIILTCSLAGACVTTSKYEAKENELKQALDRETQLRTDVEKLKSEIAALQKQFDDSTALGAEMKRRLEALGQDVNKLSNERGQLAAGLEDAQKRLEELRKQKAAAEARAATFRNLVEKLRSMIDNGQLKVTIRNGRMLIVLPNDVLF